MISFSEPIVAATALIVFCLLLVQLYTNHRKKQIINKTFGELENAEARYRLFFEQSPIPLWEEDLSAIRQRIDALRPQGVTDLSGYLDTHPDELQACAQGVRVINVNDEALSLFGVQKKSGLTFFDILPDKPEWLAKQVILGFLENGRCEMTIDKYMVNGRELAVKFKSVVAEGHEKNWSRIYASLVDITEQVQLQKEKKQMEKQLHQAQKLEAIGSLAGGIAHDFNNILSPIMGRAELMLQDAPQGSTVHEHCVRIIEGSKRARSLIKQILAFSNEMDQVIEAVSLEKILEEVIQLVRPTLPASIEIKRESRAGHYVTMADATQLHQIIMNLATNAFHAMEDQGRGQLRFILDEKTLGIDDCFNETIIPGRYVTLIVEDTGHGMKQEVMDKIFNPYFSTKPAGKGSGLGLSVAHGILHNYGGGITVDSEPGRGTKFTLYLPMAETIQVSEVKGPEETPLPGGNEHVLLVDDEFFVAEVTKDMLEMLGYTVYVRMNPLEALEAFRNLKDKIDLVITDLTMPHMTGLQLFSRIRKLRYDTPVIICTGFSEQLGNTRSLAIGVDGFLNKPTLMSELACEVRSVLDQRGKILALDDP
ncbi:MAG: hybrid sensor histidine kinase/response regulator [Desulfobulbus propionicus]|nr:MAG: hybrid sensor histidine kinase/response regulator [Desulfobulbus propionicus]